MNTIYNENNSENESYARKMYVKFRGKKVFFVFAFRLNILTAETTRTSVRKSMYECGFVL